jgi:hypothetical protein
LPGLSKASILSNRGFFFLIVLSCLRSNFHQMEPI